ncbi:hypothetical protein C7999DRAFT_32230 [Corynascus novoguineensis]|uniref:Fungal N-terminal domain-containing protein n=1 Tax=Corynascus novoguineensis TaxID=1126955 RepID=A0AAN7HNE6_9PEZI|nr:hypothetical protein C7999DRAFT_32230 [Corynascus novoguineensis]
MADGLSVAASVAGLVSLGLQVSGGIMQYFDALDCRDKDLSSARQQTRALQGTLQVIEESVTQLRSDHAAATASVQACVDACRADLKALQSLVDELYRVDQAATTPGSKIKNHGRKLLYPFNRSKLQQLETKLGNTNTTLQSALQGLDL